MAFGYVERNSLDNMKKEQLKQSTKRTYINQILQGFMS